MKELTTTKGNVAREIMEPPTEFKGYTIEEIRFQRALVALEADFCKTRLMKSWNNIQKINPLSPESLSPISGKAGGIALKMFKGLNYLDYILLGATIFSGTRKFFSFFRRSKKK